MKSIKLLAITAFLIIQSTELFSQSSEKVEMADVLRQDGKIYTVVFGLVIILTAMILLLIRVDRKVYKLENQTKGGE
ncbi:CcmD family protein [Peijinzhouia sedimentorum]